MKGVVWVSPLAAAVLFGGLWAGGAGRGAVARAAESAPEQRIERAVSLPPGALCDLEQVSGKVVVRAAEKTRTARLVAVIVPRGDSEGARQRALSHVHVDITASEKGLRAKAVYDSGWFSGDHDVDVNYTLDLPAGVGLKVATVSGKIDIADATSGAEIHDVSGDVDLSRIGGELKVESVSGAVRFSGPVTALRIKTVSGDIRGEVADPSSGGRTFAGGEIQTVSGAVDLRADPKAGLSVRTDTMSGTVNNGLTGAGGAAVRIKTLSGSIRVAVR